MDGLTTRLGQFVGLAVVYQPRVGYILLGGEHRFAALLARGERETDVYVLRSWLDFVAWMMADQAFGNRFPQTPWNAIEAAYLHEKAVLLLKPARHDLPGYDLAEYTGIHEGAIRSIRYGLKAYNDPDEDPEIKRYIGEQFAEVQRGIITGHSVPDRLKLFRKKLAEDRAGVEGLMPAAKQRQLLDNMVASLAGLADVVNALGRLHPDVGPEECGIWIESVHKAGQVLTRLKKQLTERASA